MTMSLPSAFLSVRHLSVRFGKALALDDLSLDLAAGEILGVVGESGSGKTTLGKTLAGLYRPSAGSVTYAGAQGSDAHAAQLVFQDPLSSFNPRFRLGSSVALPAVKLGGVSSKDADAEVARLLEKVGLSPGFAQRFPHELSGGQLQRVAIARALGAKPRLLIADEAVSKLDISVRAQVLNLLKDINRDAGLAIVFITHDLGVARYLSQRIAVMYFGRIVETGDTEDIWRRGRHPYVAMLLRARASPAAADEASGAVPTAGESSCNFAARCPNAKERCGKERPQLAFDPESATMLACFYPMPVSREPATS
jgi:oligopeptide/dipeptide ABC transporter ATP-binding protein